MQLLLFGLTFIENEGFIRSDSLVALCGATLLCRVTQFPGCAVQNLRGRCGRWCGDNLWRDGGSLSALLRLLSRLCWGVAMHSVLAIHSTLHVCEYKRYYAGLARTRFIRKQSSMAKQIYAVEDLVCATSGVIMPRLSPAAITPTPSLPPSLGSSVTRQTSHIIFSEALLSSQRKQHQKGKKFGEKQEHWG